MKQINFFKIVFLLVIVALNACKNDRKNSPDERDTNITLSVKAAVETVPVISAKNEDAADDPAIYVNQAEPEKSFIIGTNKKSGLSVYNMKGEKVSYFSAGLVNNADIRTNVLFCGKKITLVACSNRSNNSVSLFELDTISGELTCINANGLSSNLEEVYGFCLYQPVSNGKTYAYVNGKSGNIEQWELETIDSVTMGGKIVRMLNVETQPEGMVADDELNFLYVGEEDRGIWKFQAEASADVSKIFVAKSGAENPNIEYDIEGLTVFYQPNGKGYLIVSSQGNYSYAIFEREGNNNYLFSFFIDDGEIDGVEETDGIDVTNRNLGKNFPNGAFIAQDGYNFDGDSLSTQNFKFVDWRVIAESSDEKLTCDNEYRIR